MAQHYSNPKRESDPHSLPDVETFRSESADCPFCTTTNTIDGFGQFRCDSCSKGRKGYAPTADQITKGWYFWYCLPGCMPDSEPNGPYDTEAEALAAAVADNGDDVGDDNEFDETDLALGTEGDDTDGD